MRTFLGLGISALLVSVVFGAMVAPYTPVRLMPGKSYVYSYTGRLVSGILQLDNNAAILEIKSDIVLQSEHDGSRVSMQMTNIRTGKHNGVVADQLQGEVVIEHQNIKEYERELSKPIQFTWVNGQIKSFEAEKSEPEWSINVKKSILSLLNVNLTPQRIIQSEEKLNTIHQQTKEKLVVYPIYEDGINGICETLYQIHQSRDEWEKTDNEQVLNITKTRNYDNCLTRPNIENTNVDIRGAPVVCRDGKPFPLVDGYYPMSKEEQKSSDYTTCPYGQSPKDSPVNLFNFVKYNISRIQGYSQIESVYGEGKTVFETSGKQMAVISQQNLTLYNVLDTEQVGTVDKINDAFTHQELSFRLPKSENSERLDIPYYHLFGKVNKEEIKQLIPALIKSVANDIAESDVSTTKNTMQKVIQLTNAFAVLDIEHLEQIYREVAQAGLSKRATTHEQIVRKLFVDLIGTAGTTDAALFAKKLYERDLLTTTEAKEIFETVPQNLFIVDVKVLEEYLNLFLSEKVQQQRHLASSLGICLGKLIHEASIKQKQNPGDIHDYESVYKQRRAQMFVNSNENVMTGEQYGRRVPRSAPWEKQFSQDLVERSQILQVVEVLERALKESSTFHQKVTLIETLAHMGIAESLKILAPYVNEEASYEELPGYTVEDEDTIAEERNFIRQVVIYALTHISRQYPQEVLSLLLPVYQNKQEPYEVRIAAFTVILNCDPGKQILEQVASELHTENNRQVISFVSSSLHTVANATQPSTEKLAEDARFACDFLPKTDLGLQHSKMFAKEYYQKDKKHGLSLVGEWVSSNVSQIPRSGYLSLQETSGSFKNVMLQLGYNAKGVDSLVNRMLEPNGIVSDAFEALNSQTKDRRINRRSADSAQQALQALKERLNLIVRSENEPKMTFFMKFFERTSYYSFDRQYLHQMIDSAEDTIKDLAGQLLEGKSFHYVKLILPNQLYKVVSSELGLPVVITQRHPTILSVKINNAKLELDNTNKASPSSVRLSAQIQPTLRHTTFQFVFALSPATNEAIGCEVEKSTKFTMPVELSVGYLRNLNKLTWSVVPKVSQEILNYKSETKTFLSKSSIAGSPDRDWHDDQYVIKTRTAPFQYEKKYLHDLLGLGVRLQVSTENAYFNEPIYQSKIFKKYGMLAALIEMWHNDQITPCNVHVTLESDSEKQVTGYDFSATYKRYEDTEQETDESSEQSEESYEEENEETNETYQNRQEMIYKRRNGEFYTTPQVWNKIFGTKFDKKSIKKVCLEIMQQTRPVWQGHWDNLKRDVQDEQTTPAIIAHNVLFTIVARSSRPTFYGANVLLVKTFDERAYWLKVKAFAKNHYEEQKEQELCLDSVVSYPSKPSPFYYEPIANQDLKGNFKAQIAFGPSCNSGSKIQIDGVLEKTEEKVITPRDLAYQKEQLPTRGQDWFYKQCNIDRDQGKPLSYACERAIIEDSYYNQCAMDIEYENISPKFMNLTRKLTLAAKVALYHHLDINEMDEDNEANKVRVIAQYSTRFADAPMANFHIETPKETMNFEKIHVSYLRPISALLPTWKVYKNLLTGYEHSDKCVLMEDYIRTFDNVTVKMQTSPCQYLLAKDCSASEKFAIFARQLNAETKTKAITVLVAGSEIKLMPPSNKIVQVTVDGQTVELNERKPQIMASSGVVIYVRETSSETTSPVVVLKQKQHGLKVLYDGKNVKVYVDEQYKGATCGLCGDNNNESEKEFTGPDACRYKKEEDFVNSYALSGQHCEQTPVPKGPKVCPTKVKGLPSYINKQYNSFSRFAEQIKDLSKRERVGQMQAQANQEEFARMHQAQIERQVSRQNGQPLTVVQRVGLSAATPQQQQLIQKLRTHYIQHQNQICFSVQPILSCIEGVSRPYQMQQQVLGYHCLPSNSISAQKLAEQAQHQVLEVFGKKSVDLTSYVQVPVACTAN